MRTLTIYRDDSTAPVVYERVKHFFWTAGNTVLVIAQLDAPDTEAHHYIHWPRERFCWFKDEPGPKPLSRAEIFRTGQNRSAS